MIPDLTGANLQEVNFLESDLEGTSLRDANLKNANLENVKTLLSEQLAGADLTGSFWGLLQHSLDLYRPRHQDEARVAGRSDRMSE